LGEPGAAGKTGVGNEPGRRAATLPPGRHPPRADAPGRTPKAGSGRAAGWGGGPAGEFAGPVGEDVDGELEGEDGREAVVDAQDREVERVGAVVLVLRVQHAHRKVLRRAQCGVRACDGGGGDGVWGETAIMRRATQFWNQLALYTFPTRCWACSNAVRACAFSWATTAQC
jgi:hypothetical protein